MQFHQVALALGISSLYLGFSFTLGLLLRDRKSTPTIQSHLPMIGFIVLVFLPASAMVLCYSAWNPLLRLVVAGAGWLGGMLSAVQPAWIPSFFWERHFQRGYLALAMASVAVWGLSTWAVFSSGAAMLIGLAALTAGSSSARTILAA